MPGYAKIRCRMCKEAAIHGFYYMTLKGWFYENNYRMESSLQYKLTVGVVRCSWYE